MSRSMSTVFTIGETNFDDLDDEEFLSELCNFESDQLKNSIHLRKGNVTGNIDDNGSHKNGNGFGSKQNLLRSKGASVNKFPNSDSSRTGSIIPSPANFKAPDNERVNSNAKRAVHSSDRFSSEPPLKRPHFVKENCVPTLGNDRPFSSRSLSRNNASDHATGAHKISVKPSSSTNAVRNRDIISDVSCAPMRNLSNGFRYTQNTTSVVSSPRLSNDECMPVLRSNASCDQRRTPEINQNSSDYTPNTYTQTDSSQNLLRNSMSPSVNRQTPQFRRISKESSNHLMGTGGSELPMDSLYAHQKPRTTAGSIPPITPNRYTQRDSSQSLLRNTISPSVNRQTPEFRGFSEESSEHSTGASGSDLRMDSLNTNQKRKIDTNSIPPITPNRYSPRDSSLDKLRSSISPAVNRQTPTFKGFAKESPAQTDRRSPTTDMKCVTPNTRRFPGPAGILPRLVPGESLDNLPSPLAETPKKISPTACQLVAGENDADFSMEPWTMMQEKIQKEFPHSLDSLASVVRKAASHQLERGKVAFLAVLVKSFRVTGLDVSIVLKDPSGEMRGTLHRKVFEEQQVELGPGCGFFLKQVSVFSPSPRKHYLNITPGNILEIFPASAERCSSQKEISEVTPSRATKETEKQTMCSSPNREIADQAQTSEGTNFAQLLEGLDEDDDDMLVEAMNF